LFFLNISRKCCDSTSQQETSASTSLPAYS
jgi:hypothetical protein